MIKNYLRVALRNILRHKAYSAINVSGLAIGMASSMLILLWVNNELSYDRFHKNARHIYRITAEASGFKAAVNCAGMPFTLQSDLPVVKNAVRVSQPSNTLFEIGNRKFEEKRVLYVDSTFLQIFSFKLKKGDRNTALNRQDGVLLTEATAKKYFGKEEPMGKILKRENGNNVLVTGILENVPPNSHLQFDFILPLSSIRQQNDDLRTNTWKNFNFYTYLQLDKNFVPTTQAIASLNSQIDEIYKKHESEIKITFQLQPLTDIHLHSNYQVDLAGHGNNQYVNIFLIVALLILIVASINFMNLATARSARRAKEIGLRKAVGALRTQVIKQFLGESIFISFIAMVLAIGLVYLFLPLFNQVADKQLNFELLKGNFLAVVVAITIITGVVSGSYPAIFLSAFQPVKVLKGNFRSRGGSLLFRNVLVTTQFVVSIFLLVGTVVVYNQLNFIRNRDLGFDKENLMYIPMRGELWNKQQALKAELKENPLTANFTIVNDVPTNLTSGTVDVDWKGKDPNSQVVFPSIYVQDNFIEVFKMKILRGRSFTPEFKADSNNFVVNEKALQAMGMDLDHAVGSSLSFSGTTGQIIGVVKDFNFKPIQQPIEPLVLACNRWGGMVVVRTNAGSTESTIKALDKIYTKLNPAYPFTFSFVDQDIDSLYKGEQKLGSLFKIFAALAIFISCLGLYGLSAFMAEQRTREIGIRKVLGASAWQIVYLLSTGFTRLILIAAVISIPVSWIAVNYWLNGFAYHVDVSWIIFLIASVTALIISLFTVSYESIKAAMTNPVVSLKVEG